MAKDFMIPRQSITRAGALCITEHMLRALKRKPRLVIDILWKESESPKNTKRKSTQKDIEQHIRSFSANK